MKPHPFFSIIIPWHGGRENLTRAIASVQMQSFRDFELILVCNGAGIDDRPWVEQIFTDQIDLIVQSTPANANAARNAGITAAWGEWLVFLDADDEFLNNKLQHLHDHRRRDYYGALISRGLRVLAPGREYSYPSRILNDGDDIGEYFFCKGANCSTSAIAVKRKIADDIRFTDQETAYEDPDFLIRLQASGQKIGMLPEPLFKWHDESDSGRLSRGQNYNQYLVWAQSLRPAMSDKAYAAFCARRIAQYQFPKEFRAGIRRFWRGWRHGGISGLETVMFIVRALIPGAMGKRGVALRSALQHRKLTYQRH